MFALSKTTICLFLLAVITLAAPAPLAAGRLSAEEVERWREDIRTLARDLPKRHRNAFHKTSAAEFDAAVATALDRVPQLDRPGAVVELARLVALVGDGHTRIGEVFRDPNVGFGHFAIAPYFFGDGLYIHAAGAEYRHIVGGSIVSIGGMPIQSVVEALRPLVWRDNEMGFLDLAPAFLVTPEVLRALGIVDADLSTVVAVDVRGNRRTARLRPAAGPRPEGLGRSLRAPEGWVSARGVTGPEPMWLRATNDYYWLEYLPSSRTMYVQFNEIANKPNESLADFAARLTRTTASHDVDRLVLDLRLNTGGNNYLNRPLVLALIKSPLNTKGKLFTLIGRKTFSAAQNLVNELQKYTNTTFIGEPTAQRVNFFADAVPISLPNSGVTIRASGLWWQDFDPRDRREWTAPDVAVDLTWNDHSRGADPALATALKWQPSPSVVEQVRQALASGGIEAARRSVTAFRADRRNRYAGIEQPLNALGYELLGRNDLAEAIAVFQLVVEFHPHSSNAYDSLGEAYMAIGEVERAAVNYRRSLELDPANVNAAEILRKLSRAAR